MQSINVQIRFHLSVSMRLYLELNNVYIVHCIQHMYVQKHLCLSKMKRKDRFDEEEGEEENHNNNNNNNRHHKKKKKKKQFQGYPPNPPFTIFLS